MGMIRLFPAPCGVLGKPRRVALRREEVFLGLRNPGWIWRPAFSSDDDERTPREVFQDRRGAVKFAGCGSGWGDEGWTLRLDSKGFCAFSRIMDCWVRTAAQFGALCIRQTGLTHGATYYDAPGIRPKPIEVPEKKGSPYTRIVERAKADSPIADLVPVLDLQNDAGHLVGRYFRWEGGGGDVFWTRRELVLIHGRRLQLDELAVALRTNLTLDHNIKAPPKHLKFDAEDASFLIAVEQTSRRLLACKEGGGGFWEFWRAIRKELCSKPVASKESDGRKRKGAGQ